NAVLVNSQGCDSLLTLNLTIKQSTSSIATVTACDSFVWSANNQTYTASGVYNAVLVNSQGCDSLLTLNLTIKQSTSSTVTFTTCDSFVWSANNQTYTASGIYNAVLINSQGCDSILTLNLTIKNSTSATINLTACDSLQINGDVFTLSGTYAQTLTNTQGCDSLLTINLIIINSSTSSFSVSSCESYTWLENNQTYTQTGVYETIISNSMGCDSTITLNLTIFDATTSTVSYFACDSIEINGEIFNQSGTYNQTLTNAAGCDSLLTLQLTINQTTYSSISESACGSYTWSANNQTYTTSNVYTTTLLNTAGCDSVLTLNLTIDPIPTGQIINSSDTLLSVFGADNYQWINCTTNAPIQGETSDVFYPSSNGSYAVIMTTNAGCSDTTDCMLVSSLSVLSNLNQEVKIYPNPSNSGIVNIDATGIVGELEVFNYFGQLIYSFPFSNKMVLDLSKHAKGLYIIHLKSENTIHKFKVEKT
ncbi:MAG: T9SS type A sorting domain-containing protein, partial [Fluviicola sp.]|nr:T9SS type A sorting domain-containing protein [Fluviicola sp.]